LTNPDTTLTPTIPSKKQPQSTPEAQSKPEAKSAKPTQAPELKKPEPVKLAKISTKPAKPTKVYYIQVASLLNNDTLSPMMKDKLKRAGLKYRLVAKKIVINGNLTPVKRVLIGPFTSEAEAQKVLDRVRAEVNPNAFIRVTYEKR
jgi:cell division septation protein DedD